MGSVWDMAQSGLATFYVELFPVQMVDDMLNEIDPPQEEQAKIKVTNKDMLLMTDEQHQKKVLEEKKRKEKNVLMKRILEQQDQSLLREHRKEFTKEELRYLEKRMV